ASLWPASRPSSWRSTPSARRGSSSPGAWAASSGRSRMGTTSGWCTRRTSTSGADRCPTGGHGTAPTEPLGGDPTMALDDDDKKVVQDLIADAFKGDDLKRLITGQVTGALKGLKLDEQIGQAIGKALD